jgi:PKD domain-containing protein
VDAHLLLALSYFALDQRSAAKEQLLDVLRLDPDRTLDAQVYAPPVLRLFEEARTEISKNGPVTRPPGEQPASTAPATTAPKRKGHGKTVLIGLGITGAAGAGVAAASGGGDGKGSPRTESGVVSVSPSGFALASVTELAFTGSGFSTPPTWTFGDGARATGLVVTHTYSTEGAFSVTAQTAGATGTLNVQVRGLTGRWVRDIPEYLNTMQVTQVGTSLAGSLTVVPKNGVCCPLTSPLEGTVAPPRNVTAQESGGCYRKFSLVLNADITSMTGVAQDGNPACGGVNPETYVKQ